MKNLFILMTLGFFTLFQNSALSETPHPFDSIGPDCSQTINKLRSLASDPKNYPFPDELTREQKYDSYGLPIMVGEVSHQYCNSLWIGSLDSYSTSVCIKEGRNLGTISAEDDQAYSELVISYKKRLQEVESIGQLIEMIPDYKVKCSYAPPLDF